MSTAIDYLTTIAPTLAARSDVNGFMDMARAEMGVAYFGTYFELALAYLTAHKMTLFTNSARASGVAGQVSSKSEGQLSVSFAPIVGGGASAALNSTSYGVEYNRIRNICSMPGIAVTGGNDVGY